jgi:hypothetical protein
MDHSLVIPLSDSFCDFRVLTICDDGARLSFLGCDQSGEPI